VQMVDKDYLYLPDVRILAVDDNKMNLTVLTALLKRSQMHVEVAHGGKEAVEMTKKAKYDLILMDHMMPDLDGIQAFHIIRDDKRNPNCDTPMVVLTANAVDGMEEMYLSEGFAGYLSKPIVVDQMERMIKTLLENK